jgi:A/G-specific adenine glycosylase
MPLSQTLPQTSAGINADANTDRTLSDEIVAWQKKHGRHTLPWQNTRDAYRIWISEIMLQQTQVAAVIPYYQRFMQRFPTVHDLANAPSEEVMSHWSGLGYYSRARNLHRCAQIVATEYGGDFPSAPELLAELPGIGRSTAAAISAFAYGTRAAILDGNVKRVFCRVFGIAGYPGERKIEQALWEKAVSLLPEHDMTAYTQGLMDLGATLCTRNRPACVRCPLAHRCNAFQTGRVDELPVRKPKKTIPEKHAIMLVITHGDHVLLEQRPASGIWGGLLSLPQLDDARVDPKEASSGDAAVEEAIALAGASFGTVASSAALPRFSHTFSHFRLHVAPFRVVVARRLEAIGQRSHVWCALDRIAQAPLPAPVKKLLLALRQPDDLLSRLT